MDLDVKNEYNPIYQIIVHLLAESSVDLVKYVFILNTISLSEPVLLFRYL